MVEKELGVAPETLGRWGNQSDATVVAESKRSAEDAMAEFINMLNDYMVWYRDRRIKTESGHGHHGSSTRARSCGMIGGDGINDESNKTVPPSA